MAHGVLGQRLRWQSGPKRRAQDKTTLRAPTMSRLSLRRGAFGCGLACSSASAHASAATSTSYKFELSSLSVPKWGEGNFLTGPYQFKAGQGLLAEHLRCLNGPTCSMIMEDALDSVKDRRRPMSFYDWDDQSCCRPVSTTSFSSSPCRAEMRRRALHEVVVQDWYAAHVVVACVPLSARRCVRARHPPLLRSPQAQRLVGFVLPR